MKHGATAKKCAAEGCTNNVVNSGVCIKHGATVKLCEREGCTNQAHDGLVCIRHGAKSRRAKAQEAKEQAAAVVRQHQDDSLVVAMPVGYSQEGIDSLAMV